ncbi:hypothetical protein JTB14_002112 [Gonioctena quinquepunctata]|nr:hypothetical protein JTB14_002111 [Gonioctena quinquepunctata]KAG5887063.1 hypothetical protein JTB14_002112 [Gonioctena quinquepunctata]
MDSPHKKKLSKKIKNKKVHEASLKIDLAIELLNASVPDVTDPYGTTAKELLKLPEDQDATAVSDGIMNVSVGCEQSNILILGDEYGINFHKVLNGMVNSERKYKIFSIIKSNAGLTHLTEGSFENTLQS